MAPIGLGSALAVSFGGSALPLPDDPNVSAALSSVVLSAASIVAGASLTATITARNGYGQVLSGKVITSVTVDPTTGITVTGSGNTNGAGVATRAIEASTAGGPFSVTVVVDGVSITQVPTFVVTAAPAGGGFFKAGFFKAGFFKAGFFKQSA